MPVRDYFDYNANLPLACARIPDLTDPLATSIRIALDARKIGLSVERTEELMLMAGCGIDVEERRHP